jgi:hypothetical protein
MFCPNCKAEYRVGYLRCSDCDVALVDQLPADPPPRDALRDVDAELVVIRTFERLLDADLAKSVLEAAGIESEVLHGHRGQLSPELGLPIGIQLLVRSEDSAAADEILNTDVSSSSGTDE